MIIFSMANPSRLKYSIAERPVNQFVSNHSQQLKYVSYASTLFDDLNDHNGIHLVRKLFHIWVNR